MEEMKFANLNELNEYLSDNLYELFEKNYHYDGKYVVTEDIPRKKDIDGFSYIYINDDDKGLYITDIDDDDVVTVEFKQMKEVETDNELQVIYEEM